MVHVLCRIQRVFHSGPFVIEFWLKLMEIYKKFFLYRKPKRVFLMSQETISNILLIPSGKTHFFLLWKCAPFEKGEHKVFLGHL